MKDLLKGQNPGVLLAVALTCILMAYAARNKMLGEGHTSTDANFFFFMILAGGIGIYFIIYEGVKELSAFLCKKGWKMYGIKPQPIVRVEQPIIPTGVSEAQSNKDEKKEEQSPTTTVMTTEQVKELLQAIKNDAPCENDAKSIEDKKTDSVNFDIISLTDVAAKAKDDTEADMQAAFKEACLYTLETLGGYMSKEDMRVLIVQLGKLQRTGTPEWSMLDKEGNALKKVYTHSPICKTDLYHYGWNMGKLLGKNGPQIAFFLKNTFYHHFDSVQLRIIPKKLRVDGESGIIKIDKNFSPNYRKRTLKEKEQNMQDLANEYEAEDINHMSGEKVARIAVEDSTPKDDELADKCVKADITAATLSMTHGAKFTEPVMDTAVRESGFEPDEEDYQDEYDEYERDDDDDPPMSDEEFDLFVERSINRNNNSEIKPYNYGEPLYSDY